LKVVLTIAGSDSGGGAGIQADLKTFAAHGVHGTSAITAITAQNSVHVVEALALDPRLVVAQIEAVAADMRIAAAKTGMLATLGIVQAVAEAVARLRIPHLVVDPVMVAKGGDRLIDAAAVRGYLEAIFPLAEVVTPNLPEAAALLGRPVATRSEMRDAARELQSLGPRAVLVKGGHLEGPDAAIDVFFDGRDTIELEAPRIATLNTHGTGCTLSAAIAARLGRGETLADAVRGAKAFVTEAIRGSYQVGSGPGPVDPWHAVRSR
jgi:hydroxymethylpyrimidine/phosphomethylpyrimidine kinase